MSEVKKPESLPRRSFLKRAGVVTGAAGVAAVALAPKSGSAATQASGTKRAGYQETEHVRTYYDLARF